MIRFSIIGPGRVGRALGRRLVEEGWDLTGIAARSAESAAAAAAWIGAGRPCALPEDAVAEADVVFVTVPDGRIGPLCVRIAEAGTFRPGAVVLHTSGALSSAVLDPARTRCGCSVGSMHPLQSFASPAEALQVLPGSYFGIEGDPAAVAVAADVTEILGGRVVMIEPTAKVLYHAAACVASNYLVALADAAARLMAAAGIPPETGLEMLLPLMRGTLANLQEIGLPNALTGPIARGDAATVNGHIEAIGRAAPELLEFYRIMARITQQVADRMDR